MTRALIEARRRAIRKHLFLLCPNNSGSTYLGNAIARSRAVWGLPREGQHMLGFAGPATTHTPWPLIWGGREESLAHFRDSPDYDWERTRTAWYFHASAAREDAPVFFTKSPPFLLIADQLAAHFPATSFLIMVRDPYAALEGIVRRRRGGRDEADGADLPTIAARHLVTCFEAQRANIARLGSSAIFFTYEELCAGPQQIAHRIAQLVPELDDLDLTQRIAVKGLYDEGLRNMNADQISRLSRAAAAQATAVFAAHEDLLAGFGYRLRDPAEFSGEVA